MQYSIIARAAVASLFICLIMAAPQGRGSIDDMRTLDLPTPEQMASALALNPTTTAPQPSSTQTTPTPTTLSTSIKPSSSPSANKKKVASRGPGACKAIIYDITAADHEASRRSGLRVYQNGKLLTDVASGGADSWSVDTLLPHPVLVHMAAGTPVTIQSCSGSYADQTELEGWVGAGYENSSGLGPVGSSTCEIDFAC